MMIELQFLQKYELFGGIMENQIQEIIHLFHKETFTAETYIEKEGEKGQKIYFITSGRVEILRHVKTANREYEKLILEFGEGDSFGEMEVIDTENCAASVRTMEKTETLSLTNGDLCRIQRINMQTFTILIMNIAREISRRLRKSDAIISSLLAAME